MKAKRGYKHDKPDSPAIGRWLKRYFAKRTCRKWNPQAEVDNAITRNIPQFLRLKSVLGNEVTDE